MGASPFGLTMADCIHYSDGYRYQLRAAHAVLLPELVDLSRPPIRTPWIELDPDGWMRFIPGYAWDGASGPTYDSKDSMRGSLYHDGAYQLVRMGLLVAEMREAIDKMFHRVCVEDGMFAPRAWLWYHAVRIFAKPATDPAAESPDVCAPEGCCEK